MYNQPLLAGTLLDERYRIEAVLGEGGFGVTYAAENVRLGMKVAVKELFWRGHSSRDAAVSPEVVLEAKDRAVFEEQKARFLREARAIRDFSNLPGVVHILDYFEANATAYIVMEYVQGETLASHLASRGRIPAEEVFRRFLPLIETLGRIHAGGVIHRDISPDNIMVQPDGSLKLIDFGAVRFFSGAEEGKYTAIAKDSYAPGEQYDKNGRQGPWTDVYALCATIYTCVAGVAPLSAVQRLFLDELQSPSQLGVEIAAPYEAVIMRGLKMTASQRFPNMEELARAVRDALPAPRGAPKRRRGAMAGAAAGLILMAVIFGAWLYHDYDVRHKFRGVETEVFWLYAPQDMTAVEFAQTQSDLRERAAAFAGEENYLVTVEGASVRVELPLECFGGQEIYSVLKERFLPLVDGKRYNMEYQIQANWEDPAASILAGENQTLPGALEGACAELVYGWSEALTPGQRANMIMDLKVRLDALGTPYAFGALYGDSDSVVVRISPERLNQFVLDTLGARYEAVQIAGEYNGYALDVSSQDGGARLEAVEYADGSFGIRCEVDEYSAGRLAEVVQFARGCGGDRLYLQSGGGYALAELCLDDLPEDGVLDFTAFRFEDAQTLGAERRWMADYVDAVVNRTQLPARCERRETRMLDEAGETDFGASLWDGYGLRLREKESDRLLYECLGQIVREKGYAYRAGDSAIRIDLGLSADDGLVEKFSEALAEMLVEYDLKDKVINPALQFCACEAEGSESCSVSLWGSWDTQSRQYVNVLRGTFRAEGRFEPYAKALTAWWQSLSEEELGVEVRK